MIEIEGGLVVQEKLGIVRSMARLYGQLMLAIAEQEIEDLTIAIEALGQKLDGVKK
jgi:hypothetical protein